MKQIKCVLSMLLCLTLTLSLFAVLALPAGAAQQGAETVPVWRSAGRSAAHYGNELPVLPVPSAYVKLLGNSISLSGQIDVNFYVEVPKSLQNAGVYITLDGERAELVKGNNGTMVAKRLPAKEMNTQVVFKVYNANGKQLSFKSGSQLVAQEQYSVQDYLSHVIKNPSSYSESLVKLCMAMSDYGAYTQIELQHDVENAKAINLAEEIENVTCEGCEYAFTDDTEHIRFSGLSVVTESETAIRVYFTLTGEEITATVDGMSAVIHKNTIDSYVEIANISAKNLGNPHTIVLTNGSETVTVSNCSVYSYVQRVLSFSGASESLIRTVKALKLYGDLAKAFFASTE